MRHRPRQTRQTIENLKGEIEFREKLARQHVSGEVLLPDYYLKERHDQILLQRMADTQRRMQQLLDHGVNVSPFLELGAERGQRALVLTNDFGATGVALDISYHQLKTIEHFSKLFGKEHLPIRICCDANTLPFRSHSFPFIFCYEFLHHFPTLRPVLQEIYRVLDQGYFFFDEEPFKQVLKMALYTQKSTAYSQRAQTKNKYVRFFETFVSDMPCDEEDYGILENHTIGLTEWIDGLALFQEREVKLWSANNLSSSLDQRVRLRNLANFLLGGLISGLCRKSIGASATDFRDIYDRLGCPSCTVPTVDGEFDRPPLISDSQQLICSQCGFKYPIREGILMLLPADKFEQLYPELSVA